MTDHGDDRAPAARMASASSTSAPHISAMAASLSAASSASESSPSEAQREESCTAAIRSSEAFLMFSRAALSREAFWAMDE